MQITARHRSLLYKIIFISAFQIVKELVIWAHSPKTWFKKPNLKCSLEQLKFGLFL